MTAYEYIENLPYVVVTSPKEYARARFATRGDAEEYAYAHVCRVIDTTPKPRVPEGAKFITWFDSSDERHVARYWGGQSRKWAEIGSLVALPLEDLPGVEPDTVFTALEERKN